MSNTNENYLFLGLPKSGKTTYFVLMAQHLQDVANLSREKLVFRYPSTETGKFIDDGIDRLRERKWPMKTQGYEQGYSFELKVCPRFLGISLYYRKAMIDYHDYPGEAYEAAFGVGDDPSPEMREIGKKLKDRISTAQGIFLIIDADAFFGGVGDPKSREILTKLFRHIQQFNPTLKLAVIFNKLELFYGKESDFEQMFRKKYSNAYAYLPSQHRFFKVYPLGEVETAENGSVIPPRNLHPINILAPIYWMFDFYYSEKYAFLWSRKIGRRSKTSGEGAKKNKDCRESGGGRRKIGGCLNFIWRIIYLFVVIVFILLILAAIYKLIDAK